MSNESIDEILAFETKYPRVFAGKGHLPFVNAGWLPMLDTLCAKLEELLVNGPEDPDQMFHVDQIKEKFGGLRFYYSGWYTTEMETLIDQAEQDSYKICEGCGSPGKPRGGGWIQTLCDECAGPWGAMQIEYFPPLESK